MDRNLTALSQHFHFLLCSGWKILEVLPRQSTGHKTITRSPEIKRRRLCPTPGDASGSLSPHLRPQVGSSWGNRLQHASLVIPKAKGLPLPGGIS